MNVLVILIGLSVHLFQNVRILDVVGHRVRQNVMILRSHID